jgi:hypothetical protein
LSIICRHGLCPKGAAIVFAGAKGEGLWVKGRSSFHHSVLLIHGDGAMLQGLMSLGEVLIGVWIVSVGWLLADTLLESLKKARQPKEAAHTETPRLQPVG